jgi:ribonuclease BN (tRNA processing enzyme)
MHEAGRAKPLTILTRADIQTRLDHVINTAYPGALDDASFDIDWHDVDAHDRLGDVEIKTAPTIHTVPNRAIKLTNKNDIFCYSGDGEVTDETRSLYEHADVLVHETYTMEEQLDNHSNIRDIARVRRKHHIHHCAAVHIRRDIRRRDDLAEFAEHRGIIIPDDGDSFTV